MVGTRADVGVPDHELDVPVILPAGSRVLLTGAHGMLAHAIRETVPDGITLIALGKEELDITSPASVHRAIAAHDPCWIINAAAYTAVDRAESESEVAMRVNATGVENLATAARDARIGVVHFGSDYVFDGSASRPYTEDDVPHPLNAYGRAKLEGERALVGSGARFFIVRTQWLFGPGGSSFPRAMWSRARAGEPTRVVADQFGSPTYTLDLASAVWRLPEAGGILNVVNDGVCSWHDVARHIFDAAGRPDLLTPCSTAEYHTAAQRPANSALDTSALVRALGAPLPRWEDALSRFVATLAM